MTYFYNGITIKIHSVESKWSFSNDSCGESAKLSIEIKMDYTKGDDTFEEIIFHTISYPAVVNKTGIRWYIEEKVFIEPTKENDVISFYLLKENSFHSSLVTQIILKEKENQLFPKEQQQQTIKTTF